MENNTTINIALLKYCGIVVLGSIILYFGKTLFIPLSYALFVAIVLYPVCKWLEQHKWPRSLAITAGLLIVTLLFAALVGLLVVEINALRAEWPELVQKLTPSLAALQEWLQKHFNISLASQEEWWNTITKQLSSNSGGIMRSTLSTTSSLLFMLFLVPVFAALFLYNRLPFVQFLEKIAGHAHRKAVRTLLNEVIHTYFNFVKGMLLVYLIVGILNSVGLFVLGIPHAWLFGMLTAIMTIIPYVGIIISALLPVTVAWITYDSFWYPLGVVAVFGVVQYLEANIIFPRVVGAQLNISTWATLVAVLAGGMLWGVSGMILFIPFLAIAKLVLEKMEPEHPVNILLERR